MPLPTTVATLPTTSLTVTVSATPFDCSRMPDPPTLGVMVKVLVPVPPATVPLPIAVTVSLPSPVATLNPAPDITVTTSLSVPGSAATLVAPVKVNVLLNGSVEMTCAPTALMVSGPVIISMT